MLQTDRILDIQTLENTDTVIKAIPKMFMYFVSNLLTLLKFYMNLYALGYTTKSTFY